MTLVEEVKMNYSEIQSISYYNKVTTDFEQQIQFQFSQLNGIQSILKGVGKRI